MLTTRTDRERRYKRVQRYAWRICNYVLMTALAILFLFPLVFMLVSSLKMNEDQLVSDMSSIKAFIPYGPISLQNYTNVFERIPFGLYMFNSLLIVTSIVVLGLFVNSLAAYALARMRFPGRGIVLAVIIALIIVPFEAIAVPLLLMVNQFPWLDGSTGWLDSYRVQILPFIASAFSIFFFYQFFLNIPRELEEAAVVDGAGRFRVYWQVVIPLSRPAFATVAILQSLIHIGDFLWPLMVTTGDTYRPLMVGMQVFFGQAPRHWGQIMAFATMVTVPMLIVFFLFQKWFVRSIATPGFRG
jgi:multiple sugar transport system permease protein